MAKEILFNEEARRALGRGVDQLANAVKVYIKVQKVVMLFWIKNLVPQQLQMMV